MPMTQPLRITTDDGFQTEITEQSDGTLRVTVTGMVRRAWSSDRATIAEAIALGHQIRCEQTGV